MKIEIESKRFTNKQIFSNFDLVLKESEFLAISGPSGCGKTTLLRLVAGLDTDAQVRISGLINRVGFVFQEPRLLPWRTIRENLRLVCADSEAGREQADLALQTVNLWQERDEFPDALSLGMKRRVELARAIAVKPDLILLDEPFVSLDPASAKELQELLLTVWETEKPKIIMVSHNLEECLSLADRIVLLEGQPAKIMNSVTIDQTRNQRDASWITSQMVTLKASSTF
ncbi:MAG: ABC transporter ATP-binding protein [Sneathiella sp.]|uniref:ABC transporter ATP-binding protein n=1 Tax=Sneathiella sp. TaxID=1964365 RepID=UPI0030013BDD